MVRQKPLDAKPCRSSHYQSNIQECLVGGDTEVYWSMLLSKDALYVNDESEEYHKLREKLFNRVLQIAEDKLPSDRLQALKLMLEGKTQLEMSKILKVSQSSISRYFLG